MAHQQLENLYSQIRSSTFLSRLGHLIGLLKPAMFNSALTYCALPDGGEGPSVAVTDT
jgi:hypothetical protein